MICRDLAAVPAVALPSGLKLRPVAPGGVPLEDAVATAMRADPRIEGPPEAFAAYLPSMPHTTRLFAAVDRDGAVRGTAGCRAFGSYASVFFVNTDPGWRGRGVGRAMTAAALHAARASGARQAAIDATDAGLSIYLRLGCETVARTERFLRAG
jgi:ribosomal protein S18 acetylase RimI-like enzyme